MGYSEWVNMETGEIVFTLVVTFLSYCIIPIILRNTLIKKKEYTDKALTKIAILNSIGVKIILIVLEAIMFGSPDLTGIWYGPPILYFFINRWILCSGNKKYHTEGNAVESGLIGDTIRETPEEAVEGLEEEKPEYIIEFENPTREEVVNEGNISDFKPKKARKINKEKLLIIGLAVLSTVALAIAIYSISENQQLRTDYSELESKYNAEKRENNILEAEIDYIYSNICIKKDGDSVYYHKFKCGTLGSNFWYTPYPIERAEENQGLSPCPICF